jgi:hypothetical protein
MLMRKWLVRQQWEEFMRSPDLLVETPTRVGSFRFYHDS